MRATGTPLVEKHFTRKALAAHLGISIGLIKEEMAARRLAFLKLGSSRRSMVLFRESDVADWLARRGRAFPSADQVSGAARS